MTLLLLTRSAAGGGGGGTTVAPTYVSENETVWNDTAAKSVTMTTTTDDLLVYLAAAEDFATTFGLPTGTLTYTEQENIGAASRGRAQIVTAPGQNASGWLLTGTRGGTLTYPWGFNVLKFSGSDGIGAAESVTQANVNGTINITTTSANSAVAVIISNWSAIDYATRNWNSASAGTGVELSYFRYATHYTVFVGYYPDVGAAGVKTVGCLVSGTQGGHSIAAVEIKGHFTPSGGGGSWSPKLSSQFLMFN